MKTPLGQRAWPGLRLGSLPDVVAAVRSVVYSPTQQWEPERVPSTREHFPAAHSPNDVCPKGIKVASRSFDRRSFVV